MCRIPRLLQGLAAISALAGLAAAQPRSGSIVTTGALPGGGSLAVDHSGHVYSASASVSNAGVTPGAAQTQLGGGTCFGIHGGAFPCSDALIVKTDSSGNKVFATLLGGPTSDSATAVAIDAGGDIYVAGTTGGSFPTTANAAIAASTTSKTFAAKLSADGSAFLYVTYLPDLFANITAMTVDTKGNAHITGQSSAGHVGLVKLNGDGSAFVYTKEIGGSRAELAYALAADNSGNLVAAGGTGSADFPVTPGALQSDLRSTQNGFITKLDPGGNVIFSTLLGGSGTDQVRSVITDSDGNIYAGLEAGSLDLPSTPQSFQPEPLVPAYSNQPGGFVAKLSLDGGTIEYATYIWINFRPVLALGSSGDVYISGSTGVGFPVTASGPVQCVGGNFDLLGSGVVAHLDAQGALLDATYVGEQDPGALATGPDGSVLLAGQALSTIRFGDPGWTASACMTQSILNSATLDIAGVVPGAFMSLAGFGIGPETGAIAVPGPDGTPISLGGVQVLFDGSPVPILYAQSRQVNFQVPIELGGRGTTSIMLKYNSATFGPFTVGVRFGDPGLFRVRPNVSAQAYAMNQDGTSNSQSNPASRGSIVALWGTGLGLLDPLCPTGGLNPPGAVNLAPGFSVNVRGGGPVLYAGSAPTLACGVIQINMQVPVDAKPGALLLNPESVFTGPDGTVSFVDPSGRPSIIYVK